MNEFLERFVCANLYQRCNLHHFTRRAGSSSVLRDHMELIRHAGLQSSYHSLQLLLRVDNSLPERKKK